MSDFREYLRANLFDGSEDGTVKMKVSYLLDEVVELVESRLCEAEEREQNTTAELADMTAECDRLREALSWVREAVPMTGDEAETLAGLLLEGSSDE